MAVLKRYTGTVWETVGGLSGSPPTCRVTHNTTQSLANGGSTVLSWNSETYDTDGMHDTATNNSRITIKTAGVFLFETRVAFAAATDYHSARVHFAVNGTVVAVGPWFGPDGPPGASANGEIVAYFAMQRKLAVNDYVEVFGRQRNAAAAARNTVANDNWFGATWLGNG